MGHPTVRLESDPLRGTEKPAASNKPEQADIKLSSGVWGPQSRGQALGKEDTRMWGKEGKARVVLLFTSENPLLTYTSLGAD